MKAIRRKSLILLMAALLLVSFGASTAHATSIPIGGSWPVEVSITNGNEVIATAKAEFLFGSAGTFYMGSLNLTAEKNGIKYSKKTGLQLLLDPYQGWYYGNTWDATP